jgi:hypothetical protein
MRWKHKADPREGDVRNIRKFAWKPTVVGEYKVWLEFYHIVQQYQKASYYDERLKKVVWNDNAWVTIKLEVITWMC